MLWFRVFAVSDQNPQDSVVELWLSTSHSAVFHILLKANIENHTFASVSTILFNFDLFFSNWSRREV